MTEPSFPPELLREISDLRRRVYELERRRQPPTDVKNTALSLEDLSDVSIDASTLTALQIIVWDDVANAWVAAGYPSGGGGGGGINPSALPAALFTGADSFATTSRGYGNAFMTTSATWNSPHITLNTGVSPNLPTVSGSVSRLFAIEVDLFVHIDEIAGTLDWDGAWIEWQDTQHAGGSGFPDFPGHSHVGAGGFPLVAFLPDSGSGQNLWFAYSSVRAYDPGDLVMWQPHFTLIGGTVAGNVTATSELRVIELA